STRNISTPTVFSLLRICCFHNTATTAVYTLSLHDALPIYDAAQQPDAIDLDRYGLRSADDRFTAERDAPAEDEDDERGEGEDAEPAELDEEQEHGLARGCELGRDVHHREAGDADGARGHEDGIDDGESLAGIEPREQEQQRTAQ